MVHGHGLSKFKKKCRLNKGDDVVARKYEGAEK
jgi:hypothetical protein